mgnify:FL=1
MNPAAVASLPRGESHHEISRRTAKQPFCLYHVIGSETTGLGLSSMCERGVALNRPLLAWYFGDYTRRLSSSTKARRIFSLACWLTVVCKKVYIFFYFLDLKWQFSEEWE